MLTTNHSQIFYLFWGKFVVGRGGGLLTVRFDKQKVQNKKKNSKREKNFVIL